MNNKTINAQSMDCPGHQDYLQNTQLIAVGGSSISSSLSRKSKSMNIAVIAMAFCEPLPKDNKFEFVRGGETDFPRSRPKNQPYYRDQIGGQKKTNKSW